MMTSFTIDGYATDQRLCRSRSVDQMA